ncbi:hypothetical protein TU79_15735 [Pseudomonas trivialis]|uniref:Uncharacterized protein n=1 Tax=Pseudomonas trivialis TaxID=200450 RepID=A0A0R2ZLE6_9PSED|nr:hypothetical protein TU79_15735 [Pseudomonas trivialis]
MQLIRQILSVTVEFFTQAVSALYDKQPALWRLYAAWYGSGMPDRKNLPAMLRVHRAGCHKCRQ